MGRIDVKDIRHISEAASEFAKLTADEGIIAFYGSMGAGKTTFITALCKELGVEDVVNSPTFTIVNEYRARNGRPIYHFDFYRIEKLQEVLDIGFEEYVYSDGLSLMEWPENIGGLLPEDALKVHITVNDDGSRTIMF